MNIVNLEVKIKECKIFITNFNKIAFSLRLGTILSPITSPTNLNPEGFSSEESDISITCDQTTLNTHCRACLVIYSVEKEEKKIIGMSFILLEKNSENTSKKFKIQQCADKNAYVIVTFSVSPLQVRPTQENESQTSKSSLNEIKELHKELTKMGHRKRVSDHKQIMSMNSKIKRASSEEDEKINIKEGQNYFLDRIQSSEPNNEIVTELENKLNEAYEKITILNNMLVIEETKYKKAQKFIKKVMGESEKEDHEENGKLSLSKSTKDLINLDQKLKVKVDQERQKELTDFHAVAKERDELFGICEELYKKIKGLKDQNEAYASFLKERQNQLLILEDEIEDLKKQNVQLKTKMFQFYDQDDLVKKNTTLSEENKTIIEQNKQFQRKFKESYRAIESFKNDALEARQQIINKEQEIEKLTMEVLQLKEKSNSSEIQKYLPNLLDMLKQSEQKNEENLNCILMINDRKKEVEEWENRKESKERMTGRVNEIFQDYRRRQVRNVQVIEMRRKFMEVVNLV